MLYLFVLYKTTVFSKKTSQNTNSWSRKILLNVLYDIILELGCWNHQQTNLRKHQSRFPLCYWLLSVTSSGFLEKVCTYNVPSYIRYILENPQTFTADGFRTKQLWPKHGVSECRVTPGRNQSQSGQSWRNVASFVNKATFAAHALTDSWWHDITGGVIGLYMVT